MEKGYSEPDYLYKVYSWSLAFITAGLSATHGPNKCQVSVKQRVTDDRQTTKTFFKQCHSEGMGDEREFAN